MRVSGFTFVRNAVRLDYPVVESIRSILPIVDEFVVNVGESDDSTRDLIMAIGDPKVRIVDSHWNPHMRAGGYVLSQQTNIALFNCTGDWAIYLQCDEAIREQDHARLVELMAAYKDDERVEGLLLRRLSFFGDYHVVADAHPMRLDLACRIVKPRKFVLSRGDAASFTVHPKYKEHGRRIRVVDTGLDVLHYMDVRTPMSSAQFVREKNSFWVNNPSGAAATEITPNYYYQRLPRCFVAEYTGPHPASFADRIARHGQRIDLSSPKWRTDLTPHEKKVQWRSRLIERFGVIAAPGRSSRKLVASHRTENDAYLRRQSGSGV